MSNKKIIFLFLMLMLFSKLTLNAQQTSYIPVHFLYGSRPLQKYKFIENPWFGGKMGGHVGIEIDSNKILNFVHQGRFHILSSKKKHSRYIITSCSRFNCILGGDSNKVKTLTIMVPVKDEQLHKLDSLSKVYLNESPYDYAFLGMRCGAASYEVLAQLGILPQYSYSKTSLKVFYPKILRKQLLDKAEQNGWPMIRQEGSTRRVWERD